MDAINTNTFGARLNLALKLAGMTQSSLSEALMRHDYKLGQSALSAYTRGARRRPRLIVVTLMAEILKVSSEWLYSGDGEPPKVTPKSVGCGMTDEPENLVLSMLREIRAGQSAMQSEIGELRADMREVKLAVALLEVRTGRMVERLEKIEKRLEILPA
jgi:transcriptional regulator with XRE-family HTH domain